MWNFTNPSQIVQHINNKMLLKILTRNLTTLQLKNGKKKPKYRLSVEDFAVIHVNYQVISKVINSMNATCGLQKFIFYTAVQCYHLL